MLVKFGRLHENFVNSAAIFYSMLKVLQLFSEKINLLNEKVGKATAWLTLVLVLVVCFDVIARKLFNFSKIWIMDLEWQLFALIFLLAAGYALRHDKHVRVDLFYAEFSKADKAKTDFWGTLLFLIPWCVVVIIYAFGYAMESWRLKEGASEPGGLPARYAIKFLMVAGIMLLLLQAIGQLIETGFILFKQDPGLGEDGTHTGQNENE